MDYQQISRAHYRKTKGYVMKENETFDRTVREILALALNGFVLWVLSEACRNGIQRVYFLARDGYLMYRCAQIYVNKLQLPVECRYLYCSRHSLRLPLYHRDMETGLDYICRGGTEVTLEKILKRSGITEAERKKTLKLLELTEEKDLILPYPYLKEIKQKLKGCPFFLKAMEVNSRKKLSPLLAYLEQEGLLEEIPMALADSGWTGSMQKEINQALKMLGKNGELSGYYWGLYELPKGVKRENYHCYYFSPEKSLKKKVCFSNSLFESIFSAPHGMTTGYEKKNGSWEPVCGPGNEKRRKFMEKLEPILLEYAGNQAETIVDPENLFIEKFIREPSRKLERFMSRPTFQEAEIFGNLPFSDDIFDTEEQMTAVKLTEEELKANHAWNKICRMSGFGPGYVKESPWYEGSAVLYGKRPGYHIFMYHLYKYLLYLKKETDYKYREKKNCSSRKRISGFIR